MGRSDEATARNDGGRPIRGALLGLAAAASFGISAPLSKLLLNGVPPVLLAGLLYTGAATALWSQRAPGKRSVEASLSRADVPALVAVVLSGGVLAPVSMLFGLRQVTALAGSLLLNLEAPFTILLAVTLFGEHLGRRAGMAAALILAGALVLQLEPGEVGVGLGGATLLAGACACWALDNNLTQKLTLKSPLALVRIKTLGAGSTNLVLGLILSRDALPALRDVIAALLLGSVSYGLSVVLDAYALRYIGAAREAAYFATAPLVGVTTSVLLLHDPLRAFDVLALLAMASGVLLLLRERHSHRHRHDPMNHEHLHVHDEHHRHAHGPLDPPGEPHAHAHHHDVLEHEHPHVSDAHHRHGHS